MPLVQREPERRLAALLATDLVVDEAQRRVVADGEVPQRAERVVNRGDGMVADPPFRAIAAAIEPASRR